MATRARGLLSKVLDRFSFGGRIPGGVGLVLALTIATSLVAAFGSRHVGPLFDLARLEPARVFEGEVWRLFTWGLVELSPLRLLFSCILFYIFGKALAEEWGSVRFLRVYAALTVVAAIITCVIATFDRDVRHHGFIGSWPLTAAVTVAWGLWFPDRVIRVWMILPLKGIVIAWLTVALTIVFAVYFGWQAFLPGLVAEAAILGWLFRHSIASRVAAARHAREAARRDAEARERSRKRKSSEEMLRSLEEKDEELAPLPPELQRLLERPDGRDPDA